MLLTLWMQRFSDNGVVFSGDGGLKALLAQQIAQQLAAFDFPLDMALRLPAADWLQGLWDQGLYPFKPPYVYAIGSQRFITFPFTFPLVSAPFYALFGDRGLYLIPLLSLWSVWLRFWQIGRRAHWDLIALCMGLISLIFASPLSLYGGMYWEHTLAVALAFWGVSELLFFGQSPKEKSEESSKYHSSLYRYLSSGVLIGSAVWFRPEFLCLVAAVGLLAVTGWLLPQLKLIKLTKWAIAPAFAPAFKIEQAAMLIGAMACTVGIFFALNYAIYSHPLGIHAIQIVEESNPETQFAQAKAGYGQMLSTLGRYFPVVVWVAIATLITPELKKSNRKTSKKFRLARLNRTSTDSANQQNYSVTRFALALSFLVAFTVPLIVPPGAGGKQWGPRFYLILVPLLSVVMAEQLKAGVFHAWARRLALAGAGIVLLMGLQINTIDGAFRSFQQGQSISLPASYTPIAPALEALQQQPIPWIAISHEFVAQQLWSALPEKTFFLAETIAEVKQLATALIAQNEAEFLYVCYPHRDCFVPDTPEANLKLLDGIHALRFVPLGKSGKYPLYKVEIY
ncbi:MAG: hypothetical protein DCF15_10190 [Phormidesmis priestleyi]|uniref:Dolichol-phosphate mannosyltransferase n=1 Tax=Phormidesmis priestleyi TaxID=268141 RepID=A0A2W4ZAA5_9CYAN|nr:MAG: hypothetical protein DCF15_10190 [Phormidesmis priestleyi]